MFGRIVMDVKAERFDEPLEARKHAHGAGRQGHRPRRRRTSRPSSPSTRQVVKADTGRDFPTDPYEQLDLAIKAVFASWFGKRANDYRNSQKIAHDLGTAVNVVTMVFGNMGDDSGTGVAFTRNTFDGTKELYGEYLDNAQGEDVVAGIRTPETISAAQGDDARRRTTSSCASATSSRRTTATSRTSSSRSSAASCTCSRRASRSGPPRRP